MPSISIEWPVLDEFTWNAVRLNLRRSSLELSTFPANALPKAVCVRVLLAYGLSAPSPVLILRAEFPWSISKDTALPSWLAEQLEHRARETGLSVQKTALAAITLAADKLLESESAAGQCEVCNEVLPLLNLCSDSGACFLCTFPSQ